MPLLLVHGNLSYYRLARLIKYSFYKNITFAFVLFYFQFYCGFSGGCGRGRAAGGRAAGGVGAQGRTITLLPPCDTCACKPPGMGDPPLLPDPALIIFPRLA